MVTRDRSQGQEQQGACARRKRVRCVMMGIQENVRNGEGGPFGLIMRMGSLGHKGMMRAAYFSLGALPLLPPGLALALNCTPPSLTPQRYRVTL